MATKASRKNVGARKRPRKKARAARLTPDAQDVPVDRLLFDPENPRLVEMAQTPSQREIVRMLWREFAVDEICLSIAANGYFRHEPVFATPKGQNFVVVEGNRRLAAVRLLLDADLRDYTGATDVPRITAAQRNALATLPVVSCARSDVWQYLGFKHVNGPQAWESYSKAKYIAWVHNTLKVPLEDVARQIGDQHLTVNRLYRALMVLDQAERENIFDREDRWKKHLSFSHLYTGLDYPGIQRFLGITKEGRVKRDPVPSKARNNQRELLVWLYGSKKADQPPLIQSQNPDLRHLDEVLQSKNGVVALKRGLPLNVCLDISRGDELLFRQAMQGAKQALQQARGTLLTGYGGELDLFSTADDIVQLANDIYDEMNSVRSRRRRKKKKTTSKKK